MPSRRGSTCSGVPSFGALGGASGPCTSGGGDGSGGTSAARGPDAAGRGWPLPASPGRVFSQWALRVRSAAVTCPFAVTLPVAGLPALSPGRSCPLAAEHRLHPCSALLNHLEPSDAFFNKSLGQSQRRDFVFCFCFVFFFFLHSSPCSHAGGKGSTCREIFYFRFVIQHRFRGDFERTVRKNKSRFGSFKKHFRHNCSWPFSPRERPDRRVAVPVSPPA